MPSSAELFTLALLATGGLYVSLLAYFNGLLGTKRPNTTMMWNSEPIIWIFTLLLMVSVIFRIVDPEAGGNGPGTWYLMGAGNVGVVYIYLILKLARHTMPASAFWITVALTITAVMYVIINIALAISSSSLTSDAYREILSTLLVLMTLILCLILLINLASSLWSSFLKMRLSEPNAQDRHTAGGVAVFSTGSVDNPAGALSDINQKPGSKPEEDWSTLHPGSCIIVDFGIRRIEDHGFRADLRIIRSNANQAISVEVSNDKLEWVGCFLDDDILTDWDVPYYNSPWRYIRICNKGNEATRIAEVYDLD